MNVATRPPRGLCAVAATLGIDWAGIGYFCFKVVPDNTFGLIIYSVQLLRGRLPSELRRTITIAVVVGWTLTALTAVSFPAFHLAFSPAMTMAHLMTGAILFTTLVMVMAGPLIYNRVNYGFYL